MMQRITVTVALALLSAIRAAAQIPIGPDFRVDTNGAALGSGFASARGSAMARDGRFVITWMTRQSTASEHDIAARRFDAAGSPLGAEFLVNSYTTGLQLNEAVAVADSGDFVIVWASRGQDGSDYGVFGQRFAASGTRLGGEFQVNESTLGAQRRPSLAVRNDGGFIVAWEGNGIFARRFDASGLPLTGEFQVNTYTTGVASAPSVDFDGSGNFVVVWESGPATQPILRGQLFSAAGSPQGSEFVVNSGGYLAGEAHVRRAPDGSFVVAWAGSAPNDINGVFARRFDAGGAPLGADFAVNQFNLYAQRDPQLSVDEDGDFIVAWTSNWQDGSSYGVFARRFESTGAVGPEFRVNGLTSGFQGYPSVASDPAGNFVVAWHSEPQYPFRVFARRFAGGLMGVGLDVDGSPEPTSDGNRVLEAGETAPVAPSWLNANFGAETFFGSASAFTGPGVPGDPTYGIADATAAYGTVASGATASCAAAGDCYSVGITVPSARPAVHWDATLLEEIAPSNLGAFKRWVLHVGESFSDVGRSNPFYRFVETLLHKGVTSGCGANVYCGDAATTREQMAVFVLVSKEGAIYRPPACGSPSQFLDVPSSSPYCPWVEELVRRGVVGGCGGPNYCPTAPVSREEMAMMVLKTKDPALFPAACSAPTLFTDVPASSPYCRWIEELARRGVVSGCGGGAYCPTAPVTREQMGVFLSVTFGLLLYGP